MPHSDHQERAARHLEAQRKLLPDDALQDSEVLELARVLLPKYMHPSLGGAVPTLQQQASAVTADAILGLMALRARKAEDS